MRLEKHRVFPSCALKGTKAGTVKKKEKKEKEQLLEQLGEERPATRCWVLQQGGFRA